MIRRGHILLIVLSLVLSGWPAASATASRGPALVRKETAPTGGSRSQKKRSSSSRKKFHYEYTIEKGDTLYIVAKKYGVSMSRLKRWNKREVRKGLRPGKTLRIYSSVPIRVKRRAYHVVKRGESLRRIARKLRVDRSELRKLNRLRSSVIQPKQRLLYLVSAPEKVSESVGSCSGGKLINGERFPKGPGYSTGSRSKIYGTNETVTLLLDGFARFGKKHPDAPQIVVGNLSTKKGGKVDPHKSHQSGRDVDLGYLHKKKAQPVRSMISTNKRNLDPRLTWDFMYSFLQTGKVKYMFIDYDIQGLLCEHLKKRKFKKSYLKKIFQYPRGKGVEAVVKHVSGHHHHIHLRFVCPKKDKRCRD